jgi:hypothetical protein
MRRLSILLLFVVPLLAGPLAGQSSELAGVYTTDPITLTVQMGSGGWAGVLEVAGQRFPLAGLSEQTPGVLTGSYLVDGLAYALRFYRQGPAMSMEAEGMQVFLVRVGDPPGGAGPGTASAPGGRTPTAAAPIPPPVQPAPAVASPQPAGESTPPGGAGEIVVPGIGIRFTPPPGWIAREMGQPNLFLLGSNTLQGGIILATSPMASMEELRNELNKGLQDDGGTSLSLSGALSGFGSDGLVGEYQGLVQNQPGRGLAIGRASGQVGVVVVVASLSQNFSDQHREAARILASSIGFFTPDTGPIVQEWDGRIRGMMLRKYERYDSGGGSGGYTSSVTIDLCSAGHFFQSEQFQMSVNVPGGFGSTASQGAGAGRWEVAVVSGQPVLRLLPHGGGVRDLPIEWGPPLPMSPSSRYTRVNGVDYLRVRTERPGC